MPLGESKRAYFNGPLNDADKAMLQPLAKVVLSVMHINSVHEPVQYLRDAAFKSNTKKIEAGKRPTPTILSFAFSYARVATYILQQKIRKARRSWSWSQ